MFKRPLVAATILFLLGIFVSAYSVNLIMTAVLCFLVCAFCYARTKSSKLSLVAVLLVLAGVFRMELSCSYRESVVSKYHQQSGKMKLTVTEFSNDNTVTAYFKDSRKRHKVYLTMGENATLKPGDIIEGEITLRTPYKSKTRFPAKRESFAGNNIFLMATAEKVRLTGEREDGISGFVSSARVYMDNAGDEAFSGHDRAFFNAMVFGDKRLVSDELYSALQASGLNHIAVVSGMHLSVAITFLTLLAHLFFGKRRRGSLFVLFGAFLLTFITGAGASIIRAFIMCFLYLLSGVLYRERDSYTSLAFAVFTMVAVNPFVIFNVGFIMSVLAVMGIFLLSGKIFVFLSRFTPHRAAQVLSLSISAQLTVIPVAVYHFGTLAPYSLLTNALLVPVAGIYVVLGMVYILASSVPFLGVGVSFLMLIISKSMTAVCFCIRDFKFSLLELNGSFVTFASIWIFLTILICIGRRRRRLHRKMEAMAFAILILLCIIPSDEGPIIYIIPYGEKTMTAIETEDGESFLIDCPDAYNMKYIENPEYPYKTVVLTERDVSEVFNSENNIRRIVASDKVFSGKLRQRLIDKAENTGKSVVFLKDCEKLQIGSSVVEYLTFGTKKNTAALKVSHKGKTLITFQGFDGNDIMKHNGKIVSDYVILPYTAYEYDEKLFTGKILKHDEK